MGQKIFYPQIFYAKTLFINTYVFLCVFFAGLSVFYFMLLVFLLFQNRRDVRKMIEWLYPDLQNHTLLEKVNELVHYGNFFKFLNSFSLFSNKMLVFRAEIQFFLCQIAIRGCCLIQLGAS